MKKNNMQDFAIDIVLQRNDKAFGRAVTNHHDSGELTLRDKEQVYQNLYAYLDHQTKYAHGKIQVLDAYMVDDGLAMEAVRTGFHERWRVHIPNMTDWDKRNPDGDYQRLNQFVADFKNQQLQQELALGRAAQAKLQQQHIRNVKVRNAFLGTMAVVGSVVIITAAFVKGAEKAMARDGFIPPEPASSSTTTEKTSDEVLEEMINAAAASVPEEEQSKTL